MGIIIWCVAGVLFAFAFRLVYVLASLQSKPKRRYGHGSVRTLIVLGSGGHTAEMIAIVNELNKRKYSPRFYVLADTDKHSETKALNVESMVESQSTAGPESAFQILRVKRSREVKQSFLSAISTTLQSIWHCIPMIYKLHPGLILCNGPGTCVPICLIAFMYKVLFINPDCRIVFVESYCRTKTISLTGKILIWFTDSFVVQWPQLLHYSNKIQFFGRLL